MSPRQFHEMQLSKREIINGNNGLCSFPLKINKDSHFIKKSPPPPPPLSSSSSSSTTTKPQHRHRHHPVIIYTHSPKIIHTHPRDFMALVQKLTGLSRSDPKPPRPKQNPGGCGENLADDINNNHQKSSAVVTNDDTESLLVTTDENSSNIVVADVQIDSCFANRSIFDHPPVNGCFNNIPLFTPNNPSDFLCSASAQPFYNKYADSMLLMPNMRSFITSSSSSLEGIKEFRGL
ncbi:hypothetical protein CsSME_00006537 [Camellia sinensis var. sinensis]